MLGIAIAAFAAIFAFDIVFAVIMAVAGAIGYVGGRMRSPLFRVGGGHGLGKGPVFEDIDSVLAELTPADAIPSLKWSLSIFRALLAVWHLPVAALVILLGPNSVFSQIALFLARWLS